MLKEEKVLEKRFYSVRDLYEALGGYITKQQIYRMIDNGEIPVRTIGGRIAIDGNWARSYVNAPCVCNVKNKKVAPSVS